MQWFSITQPPIRKFSIVTGGILLRKSVLEVSITFRCPTSYCLAGSSTNIFSLMISYIDLYHFER